MVQEEHLAQLAATAVAIKEHEDHIRQAARIEDQLNAKMQTGQAKFHKPTVGAVSTSSTHLLAVPATDPALALAASQPKRCLPASWLEENDGVENEKGISTQIHKDVMRRLTFYTIGQADEPDLTISVSEDEVTSDKPMTCQKPVKVTWAAIQAAWEQTAINNSEAIILVQLAAGKWRKLQCKGA